MPKVTHSDVFDAALNVIKNACNAQHLCSSCPTTRAEALSSSLANVAMTATDMTVQNGDVSGRKLTMAQKSGTASASNSIYSRW